VKRSLSHLTGMIALAIAASLSSTADAQTTANGPYYAMPSWDQTLPASTRFIVLANFNNDAVLDRETGLVWERAPSVASFAGGPPVGTFGGIFAFEHCDSLVLGNRMGWRLPGSYELSSLLDLSVSDSPKLPAGNPFTLPPPSETPGPKTISFWTSNSYYNLSAPGTAGLRRIVDFFNGVPGFSNWAIFNHVWCVRSGSDSNPE
jgi:Protein of unknown function (DUF1566)